MDGPDRPIALFCERRAIPTEISNYPKYMRFVAMGGRSAFNRSVTGVSRFPRYSHRIARKNKYAFSFKTLNA
jgi:hypothetical protein